MIPLIASKLPDVAAACRRLGVRRLEVFGSASGNAETPFDPERSDVDLLVVAEEPDAPERQPWGPGTLIEAFEEVFGRPVDVVYDRSIRDPYFRRIVDSEREVIYDADVDPDAAGDGPAPNPADEETPDESA